MKEGLKGGRINVLEQREIERIHASSLSLLEEMGIYSSSELILRICEDGGAVVNKEENTIKLSADMIEEALETAPNSFVLYGRDPEMDILLEADRCYFGMGGSPVPSIWSYEHKAKVSAEKKDMEECTRLGQALENIDFIGALCTSGDKEKELQILHDYDAILRNTTKPVMYSAPGRSYTEYFIEMAAAASGGETEFCRRPSIALFTETVSPMKVGGYSEGMVEAAKYGVPIILALAPMMGATSPATKAGTLVQSNAEALFKLVVSQMIKPGTPVIFAPGTGTFDMGTGQYTYSSPEQTLSRAAVAQLARFYNLPVYNLGGGVEAKLPDAEAGSQAMMGILFNSLAGITLTKNLGTMASGLYGSKEMLLVCDEMVHMVKSLLSEIKVTEETLALEVIKEVGYHGNFLAHEHTQKHFREEFFFPNLFKRQSISNWEKSGCRGIMDVAHEKAAEIIEGASPVDLTSGAESELEKALQKAVEGIKKQ